MLTGAVLKEINNLKVHISRGCLSDIPAHFGTNRNENLHRSLNSRFSGSRLGIEVAVALIAVFLHQWNSKHDGKSTSTVVQQLLSNLSLQIDDDQSAAIQKMGIGVSSKRSYSSDNIKGSGKFFHDSTWSTLQKIDKHIDSCGNVNFSEETVYSILHDAMALLHSEEVLNNMSDSHAPVNRILPFHDQCGFLRTQELANKGDENAVERINNVLISFGLKKLDVPMDGDCLFSAVLLHLDMVFHQNTDTDLIEHLLSIGIDQTTVSITLLRDLMVDEWVANSLQYKPFLTDDKDFETEADKYRASGMYTTDLGDAMLLALSNVLHLQLVVFTSVPSWPYLTINPLRTIASREPICLVYIHEGSGHYCLAIKSEHLALLPSCDTDSSVNITSAPTCTTRICRCGRGSNVRDVDRLNCSNSHRYSTRCPCLKNDLICTSECKCLNCDNGKKQNENPRDDTPPKRKKRPRHIEQNYLKKEGWKFMKEQNEQTISGLWTEHEHYVFVALTNKAFKMKGREMNSKSILELYMLIQQVIERDCISLVLSNKTEAQINGKLAQLIKEEKIQKECGTINYLP